MLGLDYNERVAHEMQSIPLSYYYVDKKHPAYHAPLHWHRPSEIVRVLNGKLKMYLDEKKIAVMPGDILFINQEVIHGFSPVVVCMRLLPLMLTRYCFALLCAKTHSESLRVIM